MSDEVRSALSKRRQVAHRIDEAQLFELLAVEVLRMAEAQLEL